MKNVFIISSILLTLLLAFLGVYNFAFKNNSANPVADPVKKESVEKKEVPSQPTNTSIQVVLNEPTIGAVTDGKSIFYYSTQENSLKQASFDGTDSKTLVENLPGKPIRIVWSTNKDKALIFTTTSGPLWYLVDLKSKGITSLKPGMDRLSWTNIGENILYEFTDSQTHKNSLNTANPDGSNWRKVADLPEGSYFITPVPRSSSISFWKGSNGLETNTLRTTTLAGETPKIIFENHFGSDFLWSPDGNRLLVGSVAEKGSSLLSLGITNSQGGEYRDLLVPTLISKVAWSNNSELLYYALPGSFPMGSVLPNDYYSKKIFTKDTFWKMDVNTGKKERLVELNDIDTLYDALNPFLAGDESAFFFTDRISGKVYRIKL